MAKLQIVYEASDDIHSIIKDVEGHINCTTDESEVFNSIQSKFQLAFDEGRKFQNQINMQSWFKDSLLYKTKI